jgi:cytochrome b
MTQTTEGRVRAWDLPTRLFKWGLVILVALAWVSHEYGDVAQRWHKANGYAILTLLVFRLLWGLVGSSTSRFGHFVYGPRTVAHHAADMARGRREDWLGHTPLGGWMIVVLLLVLSIQGFAGLFSVDSLGVFGGPFAHTDFMSEPTVWQTRLSFLHHNAFNIILALVVVHILVNLFHQFVLKDRLITAMVTGEKPAAPFRDEAQLQPARALWLRAFACLAIAAAVVLGGVKLAGGDLF